MSAHPPLTMGQQAGRRSWAEPWKIKMVEPLRTVSPWQRQRALADAGYNTFLLIDRVGARQVAYVSLAATVNMAGGQPVSLANARALYSLCTRHGISVFLDATRLVENAGARGHRPAAS